jgi:hypothetical protein
MGRLLGACFLREGYSAEERKGLEEPIGYGLGLGLGDEGGDRGGELSGV